MTKKSLVTLLTVSLVFFVLAITPGLSHGIDYYISPTGNDLFSGTAESSAWKTFVHADQILQPGDTLIILDGTYNQRIVPTASGNDTQGDITYRAKNNFKAVIAPLQPDGNLAAIEVFSYPAGGFDTKHHLAFEGLIVRGGGETSAVHVYSADNAQLEDMTHHITIRRCGFYGSAQERNVSIVSLGNNLRDSLVEDIFSYGRGRKAAQAFGCVRVIIRRAVLRYDYWEGDEYKPGDPRTTFSGYNTQDSIFENMIAIDAAPTPPGYSADRGGFAASGNETPAAISGSARNKYLGLIVLNNYANGVEVNGGSGAPNEDLVFKDILSWHCLNNGQGFNVQGNDNGSHYSFMTIGDNESSGFRLDPYPHQPISNEIVTNIFSTDNGLLGFIWNESQATFEHNSGTNNAMQSDLEADYAPDISTRFLDPIMVAGHERGATIVHRYVDGSLSNTPLWPYPHEEVIKQFMCQSTDLEESHRVVSMGEGWEPGWCASGKTLTEYIWEFNGGSCPEEYCIAKTVNSFWPMLLPAILGKNKAIVDNQP